MQFTHLHVHSHYSLLDGGNRIEDLLACAREQGMSSLALTDHGNLFGAVEFYRKARAAGIKPILGMEAYIAPAHRTDRTRRGIGEASHHLLLLAMNELGWKHLMRLSSRAYIEGFYYRPRVDLELLAEYNEGLICTSACLGGAIPEAFVQGRDADAYRIAGQYLDIFGPDRFFIEIQNQGEADQDRANPKLIALARKMGLGLVGTNDVHFLRRGDKRSHEVLTCISTNKRLADPDILRYSGELYLKSPDEMAEALGAWPEALQNTQRIAEMCELELNFGKHLPSFRVAAGDSPDTVLRAQAWEGLARRFGAAEPPPEYRERLDWELKVIEEKGYSSYFLIIDDFVRFAREHDIPASPRGSGVATLLGYVLGISSVDPVKYGLLFERFTDPQRQEDPDVDIDICQEGRSKVIAYVREKYGHVAQIITYGTLKARAVIRDCGRVLGWDIPSVDRLAKMVPEGPRSSLELALGLRPAETSDDRKLVSADLQKAYREEPEAKELLDHALTLEGLARHAGVHAAGVVVCDEPLENLVPLCRQSGSEDVITQWDGPTCEQAGLMKMDLLGLKTLTVIQRARELVRARTGVDADPETLPLDDDAVYALFRDGETDGLFQFESDGMKNVLRQMQPNRLEDLIAANAMFRPGPMELIPLYCRRKNGSEPVEKVHLLVDGLLAETYGIMIYQEQVMQVLNKLGGLPLSRALTLIKAISKKKEQQIAAERPAFIEGAQANGISQAEADRLFELILKFAGYGFNKAHSTGYAIIAFQTAWFKVYHPQAFYAATLSYECGDQNKVVQYLADARRRGIEIGPPDVNTCDSRFSVDGERVRFGLMAVKGVGQKAVEAIVEAREDGGPFKDLFDFCGRVDLRAVNRSALEALIKCGAFDAAGGSHRAAMVVGIEQAMQAGQRAARDRSSGQLSFFGEGAAVEVSASFPDVPPWPREELLCAEKELLGFYVTAHPLEQYAVECRSLNWPSRTTLATFKDLPVGTTIAVCAMVTGIREMLTRRGRDMDKKMARLTLEDTHGRCEAVVFASDYERMADTLSKDGMVYAVGEVDRGLEGSPGLVLRSAQPIDAAAGCAGAGMVVRMTREELGQEGRLDALRDTLKRHAGTRPVVLRVALDSTNGEGIDAELGRPWRVAPSRACIEELSAVLGPDRVRLIPRPPAARERSRFSRSARAGASA